MGKSKKDLMKAAIQGSPAALMMTESPEAPAVAKTDEVQQTIQPITEQPETTAIQEISNQIQDPIEPKLKSDIEPVQTQPDPILEKITAAYPTPDAEVQKSVGSIMQKIKKVNPTKSKKVCYLITPYIHQNLEDIAGQLGISVNQLVNDLFNAFIEDYKSPNSN